MAVSYPNKIKKNNKKKKKKRKGVGGMGWGAKEYLNHAFPLLVPSYPYGVGHYWSAFNQGKEEKK